MAHFHSNEKIMVPLRGVAALFTLIELGLTAYAVSVDDGSYNYDDGFGDIITFKYNFPTINFLLFASLWTLLVLLYLLIAWRARKFSHVFATLALVAVTMIFWFAGFIALAVYAGTLTGCTANICSVTDAAVAFAAFLWVIFLIDTIFVALAAFRGGHSSNNTMSGQPGMAAA